MKVNTIERALYYTRGDNNDHDAAVWPGPGGLDPMLDPRDYFAQHPQGSRYAMPWTLWYVSGGKDGQEPPESQKQRMKLFDDARATSDLKKRGEIMKQVFDIAADAFETVGVCLAVNELRRLQDEPEERAEEVPERLDLAEPRPGPAAAVLLHGVTPAPSSPARREARGKGIQGRRATTAGSPSLRVLAAPPGMTGRSDRQRKARPCSNSSSSACCG